MYKRILVAVDGSDTSEHALREAISLARDQQARLRIVYAIETVNINAGSEFSPPPDMEKWWADAGREILDKARNQAQEAGVEAETRLIEIDKLGEGVPDAIVEDARAWPADLVVAGTHGRTGLAHLLMGSVAEGIVRHCRTPVLLVRGSQA
ncbi:MAG: universal stress protein [Sulfuricellaceae bacterium]|jgi:nucleotide-binding universal stress UspA family protein